MKALSLAASILFIFTLGCGGPRIQYEKYNYAVLKETNEKSKEFNIIKRFILFENQRITYSNHMNFRTEDTNVPAGQRKLTVDILFDDKSIQDKNYDIASSEFIFDVELQHKESYAIKAVVEKEVVTAWIENSKAEEVSKRKTNILSYYVVRDCQYKCTRYPVSKFSN